MVKTEKKHSQLLDPVALQELGGNMKLLDVIECRSIEPDLAPRWPLYSSIYCPGDEIANCRQYVPLLKVQAQQYGVDFLFNQRAVHMDPGALPELELEYHADATENLSSESRARFDGAVFLLRN